MKRVFNALVVSILAFSAFGVMSCKDAIVDDGTNIKSYVSSTGGAGGAVPFHMYSDVFDLQAWNANEDGSPNGGGASPLAVGDALTCTQLPGSTWWGIAFVDSASDATDAYDMTGITKISFQAKGSREGSKFKVGIYNGYGSDAEVTLTEEYQSFTVAAKPGTVKTAFLVWMSDSGTKEGDVFYIKNIAFFNDADEEVVPKVKK